MRTPKNGILGAGGLALFLTLALAGGASAQVGKPKPKIPESVARDSAMARVPKGHVQGEELEMEGGRLIYSYDIRVPGRTGVQEVNIDARTGEVVASMHEGPAKEKAEARKENKGKHPKAGDEDPGHGGKSS